MHSITLEFGLLVKQNTFWNITKGICYSIFGIYCYIDIVFYTKPWTAHIIID